MIYLENFRLPTRIEEERVLYNIKRTFYTTRYPFNVFRYRELPAFCFEPVTLLCGGNGSGKSTVLNVIAGALGIEHRTPYNRSNFFEDYVALCRACVSHRFNEAVRAKSRVLTSDDVFDWLLDLRSINTGIEKRRTELLDEYQRLRGDNGKEFRMQSMDDYDELKRRVDATRMSGSGFVRENVTKEAVTGSNGESALRFFTEEIKTDALYLLDEPENSLSPARQLELAQFISDAARFYGCQFVISTHSPFLMAIRGAMIYDLDAEPVCEKRWTELESVRTYYDFFSSHADDF